MAKKVTDTKSFIKKAERLHKNKYDYSLVKYFDKNTPVKIICKKHGIFEQKPSVHNYGSGCQLCSLERRKISINSFIKRAKKIHGDKYDYSLVSNFTNNTQQVNIICNEHGMFKQAVSLHLSGSACKKCNTNKKSTEEFIKESKKIHNNKYDYSLVNYIGSNKKLEIICPIHGKFMQFATSHLSGIGCANCSYDDKRSNFNYFLTKATEKHGHKYDYSFVVYKSNKLKVKIICPIHGEFFQRPADHYKGGCKLCGLIEGRACVSKAESKWLNSIGVSDEYRQSELIINGNKFLVDAFDPITNTVYEFYGDFWHGNPNTFSHDKVNPIIKLPYRTLYEKTIYRENIIKNAGYKLVSIWEGDFKNNA